MTSASPLNIEKRVDHAEDILEKAISNAGSESEETVRAHIALGDALCDAGYIQRARAAFERGVELIEKGVMCSDVQLEKLRIHRSMAFIFSILDLHAEEKEALERIIELQNDMSDDSVSASMERLADCLEFRGSSHREVLELLDKVEALTESGPNLRKRALMLRKATSETDKLHPRGTLHLDSDSLTIDGAARFFSLLLRSSREEPVGGTTMLRQSDRILSSLLEMQELLANNTTSDLQKIESIIQVTSDTFGADSIQTAQWMHLLAKLRGSRCEQSARKNILQKVLQIQQRIFGFDSFFLVPTLRALAHCEGHLGNTSRKLDHLRRALELQEEELGAEHKQTCTTRYFVEDVYNEQRKIRDPDGVKDLIGLFGYESSVRVGEIRRTSKKILPESTAPPFSFIAHGGGSCDFNEDSGIRIPFYFRSN